MNAAFQIKGLFMQLEPAGLDLGKVEDLVDDDEQRLARAPDRIGKKALLFRKLGLGKKLGHADDAVHGGAQLVAHIGEKDRLGPVCVLGGTACLPEALLMADRFGDVERKADHVAVGAALIDQLDIMPVPEPDHFRFGRLALPAVEHPLAPCRRRHLADVDNAFLRENLKHRDIGDARPHLFEAVENRQIGLVGKDQAAVGIEDGKPVLYRLDRVPQPPLGDLDLLVGVQEVGFYPLVLAEHGLDDGAGLDNLFGERQRVLVQLAIGCVKLGLFLFQQPFGRKARAPFFEKFVGEVHRRTSALTHPALALRSAISVKMPLTTLRAGPGIVVLPLPAWHDGVIFMGG